MSAIKFRKRLTKFKITIALPKKFGSKGFQVCPNDADAMTNSEIPDQTAPLDLDHHWLPRPVPFYTGKKKIQRFA